LEQRLVKVAVIGAGTAGLAAYRAAREHSDEVVLIQGGPYGTTCARVGCMPSKLLIAAADAAHAARHTEPFGVHAGPVHIDGRAVMARVRSERDRFVGFVMSSIATIPASDRIEGYARFVDAHTLDIEGRVRVVAQRVVIATGSRPQRLPVVAGAEDRLIVNDDVFDFEELPDSVAVFGPGVIGLELGQALSRLGVRVRIFGVGGFVGPLRDPEIRACALATFNAEFPLDPDADVRQVVRAGDGVDITFRDGDSERTERFSYVLATTGRVPNVDRLNLPATGLELDQRGIPVFDRHTLQCGTAPIFIAGDANHYLPLLHEAADEGRIAGTNAATYPVVKPGNRRAPLGIVFTDPQIATVGLSIQEVETRCQACFAVGSVDFGDQGRSRVMGRNRGLLRIYGEQGTGRFLGGEIFGPNAEHLGHLLAWAVQQRMTVGAMLEMPFYHPVIEEGLRTALRDLNHKLRLGQEMIDRCMECGPGS